MSVSNAAPFVSKTLPFLVLFVIVILANEDARDFVKDGFVEDELDVYFTEGNKKLKFGDLIRVKNTIALTLAIHTGTLAKDKLNEVVRVYKPYVTKRVCEHPFFIKEINSGTHVRFEIMARKERQDYLISTINFDRETCL